MRRCRVSALFQTDVRENGSTMGWYLNWLLDHDHDSDSYRIQGSWSVAEEEEQNAPIG